MNNKYFNSIYNQGLHEARYSQSTFSSKTDYNHLKGKLLTKKHNIIYAIM